jgi:hypothetical protein
MDKSHRAHRHIVLWPFRARRPEQDMFAGYILNISPSGLFFLSQDRCAPGTVLEMQIFFTASASLPCRVRIVRERQERLGRYVYGARFEHFYHKGRQLLHSKLLTAR